MKVCDIYTETVSKGHCDVATAINGCDVEGKTPLRTENINGNVSTNDTENVKHWKTLGYVS